LHLRFQLIERMSGELPLPCQLPDGYSLDISSSRQKCRFCGGLLKRVRTSTHHPVGLMLGRPRVRLIHQECAACGQADSLEVYRQAVPRFGNYAFDLIAEVGRASFLAYRQDKEIQRDLLARWGVWLPASSIGDVADSFLDGLAAVHQANAPALRRRMEERGGYVLHVDGTCEVGTEVLFIALAEPFGWILHVGKISSENAAEITNLVIRCVEEFGVPAGVVRDLSSNIAKAVQTVVPQTIDLICQYHFLENVGKKLCEKYHTQLTSAIRKLKLCPALQSIRKDLVRWSRNRQRISVSEAQLLLSQSEEIKDIDPLARRRFVAYMVLRWLDDYASDLTGSYFPFDLPQLAFYRRGVELGEMLSELVSLPDFSVAELPTLQTISRHLAVLREDHEVVAAAAKLEKAWAIFGELRKVLRLTSRPDQRLLRGQRALQKSKGAKECEKLEKRLANWREALRQRSVRETDQQHRANQLIVLSYLDKYASQLVGHVIELPGNHAPLVASRTNNSSEYRFKFTKQGIRRKIGVKKLTRQVQAMRAEEFLVRNLENPEYVKIVLNGDISNLASAMATHWAQAEVIRSSRKRYTTEHPLPLTKRQLRDPQWLERAKQTIMKIIHLPPSTECKG